MGQHVCSFQRRSCLAHHDVHRARRRLYHSTKLERNEGRTFFPLTYLLRRDATRLYEVLLLLLLLLLLKHRRHSTHAARFGPNARWHTAVPLGIVRHPHRVAYEYFEGDKTATQRGARARR